MTQKLRHLTERGAFPQQDRRGGWQQVQWGDDDRRAAPQRSAAALTRGLAGVRTSPLSNPTAKDKYQPVFLHSNGRWGGEAGGPICLSPTPSSAGLPVAVGQVGGQGRLALLRPGPSPAGTLGRGGGPRGRARPLTEVSVLGVEEGERLSEVTALSPGSRLRRPRLPLRHRAPVGRAEQRETGLLLPEEQPPHPTRGSPNPQPCKLHR